MGRKRKSKAYDVQRVRREHPRAYEPWTQEEDARLRNEQHRSDRELAEAFQRKPGAIRSRRKKLGLGLLVPERRQPTAPADAPTSAHPDGRGVAKANLGKRLLICLAAVTALALAFLAGRLTSPQSEQGHVQPHGIQLPRMGGAGRGQGASPTERFPLLRYTGERLTFVTWNIRGYPENKRPHTDWFHRQLSKMAVDVLCVQEVANLERVEDLRSRDDRLARSAFADSPSGTDNAILCVDKVMLEGLADPVGFQHPPQVAWVSWKGFDAVVVSLHLSWKDRSLRRQEIQRLGDLLADVRAIDPDILLAGDFNLTEDAIESLAEQIGMEVMTPPHQRGLGTVHTGRRYDYFLLSPDLANEEFVSVHIETFSGDDLAIAKQVSDHLPVVAWFRVDEHFRDRPLTPDD